MQKMGRQNDLLYLEEHLLTHTNPACQVSNQVTENNSLKLSTLSYNYL